MADGSRGEISQAQDEILEHEKQKKDQRLATFLQDSQQHDKFFQKVNDFRDLDKKLQLKSPAALEHHTKGQREVEKILLKVAARGKWHLDELDKPKIDEKGNLKPQGKLEPDGEDIKKCREDIQNLANDLDSQLRDYQLQLEVIAQISAKSKVATPLMENVFKLEAANKNALHIPPELTTAYNDALFGTNGSDGLCATFQLLKNNPRLPAAFLEENKIFNEKNLQHFQERKIWGDQQALAHTVLLSDLSGDSKDNQRLVNFLIFGEDGKGGKMKIDFNEAGKKLPLEQRNAILLMMKIVRATVHDYVDALTGPKILERFWLGKTYFEYGKTEEAKKKLEEFLQKDLPNVKSDPQIKNSQKYYEQRAKEMLRQLDEKTSEHEEFFEGKKLAGAADQITADLMKAKGLLKAYVRKHKQDPKDARSFLGSAKGILKKIALLQLADAREQFKIHEQNKPTKFIQRKGHAGQFHRDEKPEENPDYPRYEIYASAFDQIEKIINDGQSYDFEDAYRTYEAKRVNDQGAAGLLDPNDNYNLLEDQMMMDEGPKGFWKLARKYKKKADDTGDTKYMKFADLYYQRYFADKIAKTKKEQMSLEQMRIKFGGNPKLQAKIAEQFDEKLAGAKVEYDAKVAQDPAWGAQHPWEQVQSPKFREKAQGLIADEFYLEMQHDESIKELNRYFTKDPNNVGGPWEQEAWGEFMHVKGWHGYDGGGDTFQPLAFSDAEIIHIKNDLPRLAVELAIIAALAMPTGGAAGALVLDAGVAEGIGVALAERETMALMVRGAATEEGMGAQVARFGVRSGSRRAAAYSTRALVTNTIFTTGMIKPGVFKDDKINQENAAIYLNEWGHNFKLLGPLGAVGSGTAALGLGGLSSAAADLAVVGNINKKITVDDVLLVGALRGAPSAARGAVRGLARGAKALTAEPAPAGKLPPLKIKVDYRTVDDAPVDPNRALKPPGTDLLPPDLARQAREARDAGKDGAPERAPKQLPAKAEGMPEQIAREGLKKLDRPSLRDTFSKLGDNLLTAIYWFGKAAVTEAIKNLPADATEAQIRAVGDAAFDGAVKRVLKIAEEVSNRAELDRLDADEAQRLFDETLRQKKAEAEKSAGADAADLPGVQRPLLNGKPVEVAKPTVRTSPQRSAPLDRDAMPSQVRPSRVPDAARAKQAPDAKIDGKKVAVDYKDSPSLDDPLNRFFVLECRDMIKHGGDDFSRWQQRLDPQQRAIADKVQAEARTARINALRDIFSKAAMDENLGDIVHQANAQPQILSGADWQPIYSYRRTDESKVIMMAPDGKLYILPGAVEDYDFSKMSVPEKESLPQTIKGTLMPDPFPQVQPYTLLDQMRGLSPKEMVEVLSLLDQLNKLTGKNHGLGVMKDPETGKPILGDILVEWLKEQIRLQQTTRIEEFAVDYPKGKEVALRLFGDKERTTFIVVGNPTEDAKREEKRSSLFRKKAIENGAAFCLRVKNKATGKITTELFFVDENPEIFSVPASAKSDYNAVNYAPQLLEALREINSADLTPEQKEKAKAEKVVEFRTKIADRTAALGLLIEQTLELISATLEKDPQATPAKILADIDGNADLRKQFSPEEIAHLKSEVAKFFTISQTINTYYQKFKKRPEVLFEMQFGFKPSGRVELLRQDYVLTFHVFDAEDIQKITGRSPEDVKRLCGIRFGSSPLPLLGGFVAAVFGDKPQSEIEKTNLHEQRHVLDGAIDTGLDDGSKKEKPKLKDDEKNPEVIKKHLQDKLREFFSEGMKRSGKEIFSFMKERYTEEESRFAILDEGYNFWNKRYRNEAIDLFNKYSSVLPPNYLNEELMPAIEAYAQRHLDCTQIAIGLAYKIGIARLNEMSATPVLYWHTLLDIEVSPYVDTKPKLPPAEFEKEVTEWMAEHPDLANQLRDAVDGRDIRIQTPGVISKTSVEVKFAAIKRVAATLGLEVTLHWYGGAQEVRVTRPKLSPAEVEQKATEWIELFHDFKASIDEDVGQKGFTNFFGDLKIPVEAKFVALKRVAAELGLEVSMGSVDGKKCVVVTRPQLSPAELQKKTNEFIAGFSDFKGFLLAAVQNQSVLRLGGTKTPIEVQFAAVKSVEAELGLEVTLEVVDGQKKVLVRKKSSEPALTDVDHSHDQDAIRRPENPHATAINAYLADLRAVGVSGRLPAEIRELIDQKLKLLKPDASLEAVMQVAKNAAREILKADFDYYEAKLAQNIVSPKKVQSPDDEKPTLPRVKVAPDVIPSDSAINAQIDTAFNTTGTIIIDVSGKNDAQIDALTAAYRRVAYARVGFELRAAETPDGKLAFSLREARPSADRPAKSSPDDFDPVINKYLAGHLPVDVKHLPLLGATPEEVAQYRQAVTHGLPIPDRLRPLLVNSTAGPANLIYMNTTFARRQLFKLLIEYKDTGKIVLGNNRGAQNIVTLLNTLEPWQARVEGDDLVLTPARTDILRSSPAESEASIGEQMDRALQGDGVIRIKVSSEQEVDPLIAQYRKVGLQRLGYEVRAQYDEGAGVVILSLKEKRVQAPDAPPKSEIAKTVDAAFAATDPYLADLKKRYSEEAAATSDQHFVIFTAEHEAAYRAKLNQLAASRQAAAHLPAEYRDALDQRIYDEILRTTQKLEEALASNDRYKAKAILTSPQGPKFSVNRLQFIYAQVQALRVLVAKAPENLRKDFENIVREVEDQSLRERPSFDDNIVLQTRFFHLQNSIPALLAYIEGHPEVVDFVLQKINRVPLVLKTLQLFAEYRKNLQKFDLLEPLLQEIFKNKDVLMQDPRFQQIFQLLDQFHVMTNSLTVGNVTKLNEVLEKLIVAISNSNISGFIFNEFSRLHPDTQSMHMKKLKEKMSPEDYALLEANIHRVSPDVFASIVRGGVEVSNSAKTIRIYSGQPLMSGGYGVVSNVAYVEKGTTALQFGVMKKAHDFPQHKANLVHEGDAAWQLVDLHAQHPELAGKLLINPKFVSPQLIIYDKIADSDGNSYNLDTAQSYFGERDWFNHFADGVDALALMHINGLSHNDFKPENIMVSQRGGVLVDPGAMVSQADIDSEVVQALDTPKGPVAHCIGVNEQGQQQSTNVGQDPVYNNKYLLGQSIKYKKPLDIADKYAAGASICQYLLFRGYIVSQTGRVKANAPPHAHEFQALANILMAASKHPYYYLNNNPVDGVDHEYISFSDSAAWIRRIASTLP